MKAKSIIKEFHADGPYEWWGVHYDAHGFERERRNFQTRKEARAWVNAKKAEERGDLRSVREVA